MNPLTQGGGEGVGRGWGPSPPTEAATSNLIQAKPPREGRGLPKMERSEVTKPPNSTRLCFWGAVSRAQQKRAPLKGSFVSENPSSHGVK